MKLVFGILLGFLLHMTYVKSIDQAKSKDQIKKELRRGDQ